MYSANEPVVISRTVVPLCKIIEFPVLWFVPASIVNGSNAVFMSEIIEVVGNCPSSLILTRHIVNSVFCTGGLVASKIYNYSNIGNSANQSTTSVY